MGEGPGKGQDLEYLKAALRRWRPNRFGAREDPSAVDEYEAYAPHVARLLQGGADAVEIERHLGEMRERSASDERPHPSSDRPTAEDIVAWWRSRGRQ